jgi:hypothetical protein
MVLLVCPTGLAFNEDDKSSDWFKKIADNGKRAMDDSKATNFKKFIPSDAFDFDQLSEKTLAAIESGMPGKIGYGFLMGYSSGFCLKKVCTQLIIIFIF